MIPDLMPSDQLTQALTRSFSSCRRLIGAAAGCLVFRTERASQGLLLLADSGNHPRLLSPGAPMPIEGLPSEACERTQALFCNDPDGNGASAWLPEDSPTLESVLWAPMIADSSVLGVLGLANKPGGFDSQDAEIAQACADMAALMVLCRERAEQALDRGQDSEALIERLRFEEVVTEIATVFASTSAGELGDAIRGLLEGMTGLLQCDRALFCRVDPVARTLVFEQLFAVRPDLAPLPEDTVKDHHVHWHANRLLKGEVIAITEGEAELPSEAVTERRWFERYKVWAQLSIPVRVDGKVSHMLGFETLGRRREWPEALIRRVTVVADLIGKAIERQQSDAAARELHERLAHVARVMTTGELAASFAHQLNQPLTAIASNARAAAHFLAADKPDLEELQEIVADITDEALRAGAIIAHMRDHLRRSEPRTEPVDLCAAVGEVTHVLTTEAVRRRVDFRILQADCHSAVAGDRVQLQQVVQNLVMNAFDAVENQPTGLRQVTVCCSAEDKAAVLVVEDTGHGLPEDRPESVFEAFMTTKAGGVGLGLPISRWIAVSHGGSLHALLREGGGARFELRLPLLEPSE